MKQCYRNSNSCW